MDTVYNKLFPGGDQESYKFDMAILALHSKHNMQYTRSVSSNLVSYLARESFKLVEVYFATKYKG